MNKKIIMFKLLLKSGSKKTRYLKKLGIFKNFGDNCYWHSYKIPNEPWLISIGNNVKIASNVTFITHDIINSVFNEIDKKNRDVFYGNIDIYDNVMIGANSTIMYNVKIGPNAIVAAGSVVTKDVPENSIVAGNPARIIGKFDDLMSRRTQMSGF